MGDAAHDDDCANGCQCTGSHDGSEQWVSNTRRISLGASLLPDGVSGMRWHDVLGSIEIHVGSNRIQNGTGEDRHYRSHSSVNYSKCVGQVHTPTHRHADMPICRYADMLHTQIQDTHISSIKCQVLVCILSVITCLTQSISQRASASYTIHCPKHQ
jgi:hypothetical protein